jgi:putative Holliday junction resolvase
MLFKQGIRSPAQIFLEFCTLRVAEMTGRRWLALDIGSKRIGVAVSDPLKLTARPLTVFVRRSLSRDVEKTLALVKAHDVERVLLGNARHLDGRRSEVENQALEFKECLTRYIHQEQLDVRLAWAEERLSSKEAESLMRKLGVPVKQRRKRRDEFAAALILAWYLEELHGAC